MAMDPTMLGGLIGGFAGLRGGLQAQDAKQREGALNAVLTAYSPWLAPELVKQINLAGMTRGNDIFTDTGEGVKQGINFKNELANNRKLKEPIG